MELEQKLQILKGLGTKELIGKLIEYENQLDKEMREEASFKNLNYGYLASGTSDCSEIKQILAELLAQVPETTEAEKPLTKAEKGAWLKEQQKQDPEFTGKIDNAPATTTVTKTLTENDKKAWLERQRTENQELSAAINRQTEVAFLLDNARINIEMAKKRLEGTRAVLALRTAQIRFLSDSE